MRDVTDIIGSIFKKLKDDWAKRRTDGQRGQRTGRKDESANILNFIILLQALKNLRVSARLLAIIRLCKA
jgi:hypothetical protein